MKSQICLSLFVLLVGIFSFTQVQGSELTALDFEQIDFLFPIENEETSAALLSSADTVIAVSEEEGTTPSEEGSGPSEEEAGSGGPGSETKCNDENCATCTATTAGTCTVCKQGYEVVNGNCNAVQNKVSCEIRFGGDLIKYEADGGDKNFEDKMTIVLDLDDGQVNVTKAIDGSIIVGFDVFVPSTSKFTATQIKKNLDTLGNNKDASLDIFGTGILNYYESSVVAVGGGCPAGYYADANSVCQACEEGCTYCESDGKCKGANVGAIVGGILGGIALIMVIVVAYVKKDVLFKGFSSSPKSPNRAAYYAAGPVSPTEQAPLQA